ncbi:Tricorn protease C1 domain-containing protein [Dyadobacter sp. SG02]|uniref:S41 family peptidase n=1 Tax=Dyadobacter sp. SG02 TaxID=1855291 RepID=UPI0008AFDBDC|nr:S41 family peptidase [Dyadobacter sp. SG02]SEJ38322.1 Tricorn protease C1 domain-containing protein [Dyadobacter sp. SG02]
MKRNTLLLTIFSILLFSGCESAFFDGEKESKDPMKNFEYLWNQCNEKYAYFELKGINWDEVKTRYSAKIYQGMSDDSLFNVLGAMLNELRDDHTNLVSNFNISSYKVFRDGPDNFDWRFVQDNYLPRNYHVSGPFSHDFIANGQIGYVRFPAFTGTVDKKNIDFVLDRYKDTKGLILDLRENGGGAVTDVFELLSRFIDQKTLVYYVRVKNGPGHNDFSEPQAAYVEPYDGVRYTKKIAVLIDRGTFSAASFTSLATKALDNVVLIGDKTGGGLGLPNGGQLPNGWTYRFSISQALTLDKSNAFEAGVPADIPASFDWNNKTKDTIIERAIEELL